MQSTDIWEQIEAKMTELRILTEANWRNAEYELAALGERVLRTVERSKAESEILRADAGRLEDSIENLKQELQFKSIFEEE